MVNEWLHWCRLCAKEDSDNTHVDISLENEKEIPLYDTINKCFSIDINHLNGSLILICKECFSLLISVINLAQKTTQVQKMFAELLINSENPNLYEIKKRYKLIIVPDTNIDFKDPISLHSNQKSIDTFIQIKEPLIKSFDFANTEQNQFINTKALKTETETTSSESIETFIPIKEPLIKSETESSHEEYSCHSDSSEYMPKRKNKLNRIKKTENKTKLFSCTKCQTDLLNHLSYVKHMKAKHNIIVKPMSLNLICEYCGKEYKSRGGLKEHRQLHNPTKSFKCKHCDKTFYNSQYLKRHEETHNETKYVCVVCGLQLNTKRTLRRHMIVHSDKKKYKCDLCDNEYKRAEALKYHLLTHCGVRQFYCDFCDKTFTTGASCRQHLKRHHPVEFAHQQATGQNQVSKVEVPELNKLRAELLRLKEGQVES